MSANLSAGNLRFVRHTTRFPAPVSYFGLDLGQRRDHSALAVLQLHWQPLGTCPATFEFLFQPSLHVLYLRRFPIGISYEDLYALIRERLNTLAPVNPASRACTRKLIIDAAGPGSPIVDRLRRNLGPRLTITPVILTAGKSPSALSNGYAGVPRRAVISNFQLLIAARSLKCPKSLDGYQTLEAELLEINGGNAQSKAHDDLVIATGLAAWAATQDFADLLPSGGEPGGPSGLALLGL
jgi:hypothetical protein